MEQKPTIGDDAVRTRTGKDWSGWFRSLDRAGAKRMDHKQIVAHLRTHYELSPWWQRSVTVAYEQARGLRDVHEKPAGYEIGRSKTIAAPLAAAAERMKVCWKRNLDKLKELLES